MRKFEMPIPQDLTRRPKRILIVEDDPIVRRLLLRTFGNAEGLDIKTCESGLEAMIAIGKEAPDLLILDINIPQVNGLEVCRLLKANAHTTPIKIISISGQTLTESEQEFLHVHADCFFPKPLTPELLRIKALDLLDMKETTTKEGSPSTS